MLPKRMRIYQRARSEGGQRSIGLLVRLVFYFKGPELAGLVTSGSECSRAVLKKCQNELEDELSVRDKL